MKKAVNFVYVSKEHLRKLEEEFSAGIHQYLPGWKKTTSIVKVRKECVNITFFIFRRAHIMMSHGVADKNYLLRRNKSGGLEINKYDFVCVPGRWMKRKLLNHPEVELDESQIRLVGWPRLDKLLEAQQQRTNGEEGSSTPIKVLWAPTHGGGERDGEPPISTYPHFEPYLDQLREIFDVRVSTHPHSRSGGKPTFEQLLEADVVIADQGTLVYEAWSLGKPVVFPDWIVSEGIRLKRPGSAEAMLYEEDIGLHAQDIDELIDMVQAARAPDTKVQMFIDDYIDRDSIGCSFKKIADIAEEVWRSGVLRVKPKGLTSYRDLVPAR